MKNIKSYLVDNIGLPLHTEYSYTVKVDVFHTDVPDKFQTVYQTSSYDEESGEFLKDKWFTDYFPAIEELAVLKAKYKFNRFKLIFKVYERSQWAEKNSKACIDYTFLLHTDKCVTTYEEIEVKIAEFLAKYTEKYNIQQ